MSNPLQTDIRKAVQAAIANHFTIRVQAVYASLQNDLGIDGSIAPWEIDDLEERQASLANYVGVWLCNGLSFDQAEAIGMDATLR